MDGKSRVEVEWAIRKSYLFELFDFVVNVAIDTNSCNTVFESSDGITGGGDNCFFEGFMSCSALCTNGWQ